MSFVIGLPPSIPSNCRVLILGSMPSVRSIQLQRYYAHPRNRFWRVVIALLRLHPDSSIHQCMLALHQHHIGLWDVIAQCRRHTSADSAIVWSSVRPNPLPELIAQTSSLARVLCNGQTAFRAWKHCIADHVRSELSVHLLPSTSPANARWSMEALVEAWREHWPCVVNQA